MGSLTHFGVVSAIGAREPRDPVPNSPVKPHPVPGGTVVREPTGSREADATPTLITPEEPPS